MVSLNSSVFVTGMCCLFLRANFKLVAVSGKLYAVGGHCLGTVECYSPEQDWWTCVSSMPDPLAEFSACECQGMIYVMGGYTARGACQTCMERGHMHARGLQTVTGTV